MDPNNNSPKLFVLIKVERTVSSTEDSALTYGYLMISLHQALDHRKEGHVCSVCTDVNKKIEEDWKEMQEKEMLKEREIDRYRFAYPRLDPWDCKYVDALQENLKNYEMVEALYKSKFLPQLSELFTIYSGFRWVSRRDFLRAALENAAHTSSRVFVPERKKKHVYIPNHYREEDDLRQALCLVQEAAKRFEIVDIEVASSSAKTS